MPGPVLLYRRHPATGWLEDIAINNDGFVLTGTQLDGALLGATWAELGRRPLPFETSQPLIFAVGDVRAGSMKCAGPGRAVTSWTVPGRGGQSPGVEPVALQLQRQPLAAQKLVQRRPLVPNRVLPSRGSQPGSMNMSAQCCGVITPTETTGEPARWAARKLSPSKAAWLSAQARSRSAMSTMQVVTHRSPVRAQFGPPRRPQTARADRFFNKADLASLHRSPSGHGRYAW